MSGALAKGTCMLPQTEKDSFLSPFLHRFRRNRPDLESQQLPSPSCCRHGSQELRGAIQCLWKFGIRLRRKVPQASRSLVCTDATRTSYETSVFIFIFNLGSLLLFDKNVSLLVLAF